MPSEMQNHDSKSPHEGAGILMLHGLGSAPGFWEDATSYFSEKKLITSAPSLAGHGEYHSEFANTGWELWADSVQAAFTDLNSQVAMTFIVGHSLGATLALYFAASNPLPVTNGASAHGSAAPAGLVLMAPSVALSWKFRLGLATVGRVVRSVPLRGFDANRTGLVRNPNLGASSMPMTALRSTKELDRVTLSRLGAVTCPVLILEGALDRVVPHGSATLILNRISSADKEITVLARSRHAIPLDYDRDIALELSLNFVKRVAGTIGSQSNGN